MGSGAVRPDAAAVAPPASEASKAVTAQIAVATRLGIGRRFDARVSTLAHTALSSACRSWSISVRPSSARRRSRSFTLPPLGPISTTHQRLCPRESTVAGAGGTSSSCGLFDSTSARRLLAPAHPSAAKFASNQPVAGGNTPSASFLKRAQAWIRATRSALQQVISRRCDAWFRRAMALSRSWLLGDRCAA